MRTHFMALFLSFFLTHSVFGAEYNFYFYDNEKPKTEEKKAPEENKPEVLQTIENRALPVAVKLRPKSYFLSFPENYFSVGLERSIFYADSTPGSDISTGDSATSFLVRTKFLPLITLEASAPNGSMNDYLEIYRVGGLIELGMTNWLSINLGGGILYNAETPYDSYQTDLMNGRKWATTIPYVGAGLKLRLWNHFDASLSINQAIESYDAFYPLDKVQVQGHSLYTLGLTYVL